MLITPSLAIRNATASLWLAAIDAGASNATIELYSGTKPAGPDTAITSQVKLAGLTCASTPGVVASGSLTFNAVTQDSAADASGSAAWARIKDGDGLPVIDVDASTTAGTAFLKLNTTNIVQDGPVLISSFVINF